VRAPTRSRLGGCAERRRRRRAERVEVCGAPPGNSASRGCRTAATSPHDDFTGSDAENRDAMTGDLTVREARETSRGRVVRSRARASLVESLGAVRVTLVGTVRGDERARLADTREPVAASRRVWG
jgi:hypothetical protein